MAVSEPPGGNRSGLADRSLKPTEASGRVHRRERRGLRKRHQKKVSLVEHLGRTHFMAPTCTEMAKRTHFGRPSDQEGRGCKADPAADRPRDDGYRLARRRVQIRRWRPGAAATKAASKEELGSRRQKSAGASNSATRTVAAWGYDYESDTRKKVSSNPVARA
jgi:hypothetical protein